MSTLVHDTVEAEAKYANYLTRQESEMSRWRRIAQVKMPADMVYSLEMFPSLSNEEREVLNRYKPTTLHAASQLQGITPSTVLHLQNYMNKRSKTKQPPPQQQQTHSKEVAEDQQLNSVQG